MYSHVRMRCSNQLNQNRRFAKKSEGDPQRATITRGRSFHFGCRKILPRQTNTMLMYAPKRIVPVAAHTRSLSFCITMYVLTQ